MPCYTNQTATVEFGKNTDLDLLAKAFELTGERIYGRTATSIDCFAVRFKNGKLEYAVNDYTQEQISRLKRQYSELVIEKTAQKNGWQLQWTVNAAGNRVAQVERQSR